MDYTSGVLCALNALMGYSALPESYFVGCNVRTAYKFPAQAVMKLRNCRVLQKLGINVND